ncbi:RidA family protein [Neorhizobium galegae]|uniref:RidA family protein n=1 Tax=Neorhizobium galegae TaxID=399 RepID=UPI0006274BD1|nr:RidA family protein [Neorhizobium galegae]
MITWREAVIAGDLVMISGQFGVGKGPAGTVAAFDAMQTREERVASQTRQALKNIEAVLSHNGLTISDVVRCGVSLASADDYRAMNEEYARVFHTNPPARTTVALQLVLPHALVEIDCIAYRGSKA